MNHTAVSIVKGVVDKCRMLSLKPAGFHVFVSQLAPIKAAEGFMDTLPPNDPTKQKLLEIILDRFGGHSSAASQCLYRLC